MLEKSSEQVVEHFWRLGLVDSIRNFADLYYDRLDEVENLDEQPDKMDEFPDIDAQTPGTLTASGEHDSEHFASLETPKLVQLPTSSETFTYRKNDEESDDALQNNEPIHEPEPDIEMDGEPEDEPDIPSESDDSETERDEWDATDYGWDGSFPLEVLTVGIDNEIMQEGGPPWRDSERGTLEFERHRLHKHQLFVYGSNENPWHFVRAHTDFFAWNRSCILYLSPEFLIFLPQ